MATSKAVQRETHVCVTCGRPGGRDGACMYCGTTAASPTSQLPPGPFHLTCPTCSREKAFTGQMLEARKDKGPPVCAYCAVDLTLPQAVATFFEGSGRCRTFLMQCAGCMRNLRVEPQDDTVDCQFCRLRYLPPSSAGAPPALGPLEDGPLAEARHVEKACQGLPRSSEWDLLRTVLLARAQRGELLQQEIHGTLVPLTHIVPWSRRPKRWTLPLTMADAEQLLPRVLLGSSRITVSRQGAHTELDVTLGTAERANLKDIAQTVANRAALAAINPYLAIPAVANHRMQGTDKVETAKRFHVLVQMRAIAERETEFRVRNRIDEGPPTALSEEQVACIDERLGRAKHLLIGYFINAAIFGTSCRDTTAFSLVRPAIERRLQILGCAVPPGFVEHLEIRSPASLPFHVPTLPTY